VHSVWNPIVPRGSLGMSLRCVRARCSSAALVTKKYADHVCPVYMPPPPAPDTAVDVEVSATEPPPQCPFTGNCRVRRRVHVDPRLLALVEIILLGT
jgi:hypothetical protein